MKLVGLGESAQALLSQFATTLTGLGADVPDGISYVGSGIVPWDGPGLTMYLGALGPGQAGKPVSASYRTSDQIMMSVILYVQIIREVSTFGYGYMGGAVQLPGPDDLNDEGMCALNDAGYLIAAAIAIKTAGQAVPLGIDYAIGNCVPLGPDGGLAAMRIELNISIDGT